VLNPQAGGTNGQVPRVKNIFLETHFFVACEYRVCILQKVRLLLPKAGLERKREAL
jgi:hypothetical protein